MTNTREEFEKWCIMTMPPPVAKHNIGHGYNLWEAWQHQQEIIDELQEKLQGYKFALDAEQAHVERLQAKIDSLMLEYCSDEMTEEQLEIWGKHQAPSEAE